MNAKDKDNTNAKVPSGSEPQDQQVDKTPSRNQMLAMLEVDSMHDTRSRIAPTVRKSPKQPHRQEQKDDEEEYDMPLPGGTTDANRNKNRRKIRPSAEALATGFALLELKDSLHKTRARVVPNDEKTRLRQTTIANSSSDNSGFEYDDNEIWHEKLAGDGGIRNIDNNNSNNKHRGIHRSSSSSSCSFSSFASEGVLHLDSDGASLASISSYDMPLSSH